MERNLGQGCVWLGGRGVEGGEKIRKKKEFGGR